MFKLSVMGILINDSIKTSVSKGKLIGTYAAVIGCIILIVCNLGFFVFAGKIAVWLAVILSNALTIFFLLLAFRPISTILQREFSRKANELVQKEKDENAMKERILELENQNRELENRLDTWSQTAGIPANVILTSKVETMAFNKSGYIVKEEPLEQLKSNPQYGLQDKSGFLGKLSRFMESFTNPGGKKVLYIGKYYASASLGLDFGKIRFATSKDTLYLYGIDIAKLHDLPTVKSPGDVNHCWLVSGDSEEEITVNQSEQYKEFLDTYKNERQLETAQGLEKEVDSLCRLYTESFRNSLTKRFPGIVFRDTMDDGLTWQPLGEHLRDQRINNVAANMFLIANSVNSFFEQSNNTITL